MSDHVAVMSDGVIEQVAEGRTVYDDPATPFVASFVGENNCFSGKVVSTASNDVLVDTSSGPLTARIGHRGARRAQAGRRCNGVHPAGVVPHRQWRGGAGAPAPVPPGSPARSRARSSKGRSTTFLSAGRASPPDQGLARQSGACAEPSGGGEDIEVLA